MPFDFERLDVYQKSLTLVDGAYDLTQAFSTRRTLRTDIADAQSRHLHCSEHRGGRGPAVPTGVPPVPVHSQRFPQRAVQLCACVQAAGLSERCAMPAAGCGLRRSGANALRPHASGLQRRQGHGRFIRSSMKEVVLFDFGLLSQVSCLTSQRGGDHGEAAHPHCGR